MWYAKTYLSSTIIILMLSVQHVSAQKSKLDFGVNGGAYVYQGDLTSNALGSFKTIKPGFGIFIAKPLTESFSAKLLLSVASLRGDDTKYGPEYRQHRALKFTSGIKEISLLAQYQFLKERRFQPYVFAGAGVSFMKVVRDYTGFDPSYFSETDNIASRLVQDIAVAPPKVLPVLPVGLGIMYRLSESFSFNVEMDYRLSASDYIDGFSISGNPKRKDHYSSINAGVVYHFASAGKGIKCPANVY